MLGDASKACMFEELEREYSSKVEYEAGGAAFNVVKLVEWLWGTRGATALFGCIGLSPTSSPIPINYCRLYSKHLIYT